jgi:tetratricopeptide (TPR) repeat protein
MNQAQRRLSTCLLILLTLMLAGKSQAQMGGIDPEPGSPGTGGRNTIEGRIYYPSGRNVDKRFKVRLTGIRSGDFFTSSDDTGAFSFRRLAGGTYVVTVDGANEFETVNEQVDVIDTASSRGTSFGRTYNLQIRLNYKSTNEKSGVVDAGLMAAPKPAAELYEKALQAEKTGNDAKAIEQLQRAISLYPKFPLALNKLGVIYQRMGKLDEAEKAFSAAIAIEPEVFELRLNYGVVLLKDKHYLEADTQFDRAIKIKSTPLAHLFKGKTLIHLARFPDAEKELRLVIDAGGDEVPMAYRFLGALYNEKGEAKLAVIALEKYLSLAPNAKDAEAVREIIKQLRTQTGG